MNATWVAYKHAMKNKYYMQIFYVFIYICVCLNTQHKIERWKSKEESFCSMLKFYKNIYCKKNMLKYYMVNWYFLKTFKMKREKNTCTKFIEFVKYQGLKN